MSNTIRLYRGKPRLSRQMILLLGLLCISGVVSSSTDSPLLIDFADQDCDSDPPFEGTVRWDLGDQFDGQVQLRIDSATGDLFAASDDSKGKARTGKWVVPGMKLVLLNQEDGSVLAELVVEAPPCDEQPAAPPDEPAENPDEPAENLVPEKPSPAPVARAPVRPLAPPPPPRPEDLARTELDDRATLKLSPPRLRYCGLPVDRATVRVHWDIAELGLDHAQVYVNSLDGEPFVEGGVSGERITGDWVTNGMRFLLYLPDQEKIVAESEFRILPCNVVDYPDEAE